LLGRLRRGRAAREAGASSADQRLLIVGLGNPGERYARSRHNIGFEVAAELERRWDLSRSTKRFRGLIAEGRAGDGGPRVAVLRPQTYMNDSGTSAGPARGSLKVPLENAIVVHDEIDLPFGDVRSRLGGGLAGHNGLKSLAQGFGGSEFWRIRVGVGRPDSTDPDVVARYVLSTFAESDDEVRELIARAADEAERLVREVAEEEADPIGEVID
jgi:PTH1 family peptidyl-tRNA hydrolase